MNTITQIIIDLFTVSGATKVFEFIVVILMVIYMIFSFIIVRQTALMHTSLKTSAGPVFKFTALCHFFVAVVVAFLGYLSL